MPPMPRHRHDAAKFDAIPMSRQVWRSPCSPMSSAPARARALLPASMRYAAQHFQESAARCLMLLPARAMPVERGAAVRREEGR